LQTKHKKLLRLQVTTKSKSHSSSTKYSWTPVSAGFSLLQHRIAGSDKAA
jgi:hypothetical protein